MSRASVCSGGCVRCAALHVLLLLVIRPSSRGSVMTLHTIHTFSPSTHHQPTVSRAAGRSAANPLRQRVFSALPAASCVFRRRRFE
uniref:Putative secreted protein n=1 Tax=Anopheles darlingi TaxID=43151 RepID=A0A2M4DQU6_ANODA